MDIEIRPATEDDLHDIVRVDSVSFGFSYTDDDDISDIGARGIRFLVATEADAVVGVCGDFRFELTPPGGAPIGVPGVTWVSVLPTHRRRGVLSAMMAALIDGYRSAGDPAAVLTASEGGIYRRFGYGPATLSVKQVIERRHTRLRHPVDASAVQVMPAAAARQVLPELHQRWCASTPGALSRDESWWHWLFLDRPSHRDGKSERFYLVHPGGYVAYRAEERWIDGHAASRCVITDYKIITREAHAALWQVLLGMDLFSTIESWEIPLDDPLALLVTDARQLRLTAAKDGMWLRPVDPAALLASRRYQTDIDVVVDVDGERVALAGDVDGAVCTPTSRPAQVRLDRAALGSLFLGGHRANALARAGVLQCTDPALLHQLDLACQADRAPAFGTAF